MKVLRFNFFFHVAAVSTLDRKTLGYEQAQGGVRYQSSDSHLD